MRTGMIALALLSIWIAPAFGQESRKAARTSPTAERNPGVAELERRLAELERAASKGRPEIPLESRIEKLADRIAAMEARLAALEQVDGVSRLEALEETAETLSAQLSSLQDVIRVDGSGVQIVTAGKLSLAGSGFEISAGQGTVNAAHVEFGGILEALTVEAETIVADTYTPGAGNIW